MGVHLHIFLFISFIFFQPFIIIFFWVRLRNIINYKFIFLYIWVRLSIIFSLLGSVSKFFIIVFRYAIRSFILLFAESFIFTYSPCKTFLICTGSSLSNLLSSISHKSSICSDVKSVSIVLFWMFPIVSVSCFGSDCSATNGINSCCFSGSCSGTVVHYSAYIKKKASSYVPPVSKQICLICKKPYTVTSDFQKYYKECTKKLSRRISMKSISEKLRLYLFQRFKGRKSCDAVW